MACAFAASKWILPYSVPKVRAFYTRCDRSLMLLSVFLKFRVVCIEGTLRMRLDEYQAGHFASAPVSRRGVPKEFLRHGEMTLDSLDKPEFFALRH